MFFILIGCLILVTDMYFTAGDGVIEVFPNALAYVFLLKGMKETVTKTVDYNKTRCFICIVQFVETIRLMTEIFGRIQKNSMTCLVTEVISLGLGLFSIWAVTGMLIDENATGKASFINQKLMMLALKVVTFSCILKYLYLFNEALKIPTTVVGVFAVCFYISSFIHAYIASSRSAET